MGSNTWIHMDPQAQNARIQKAKKNSRILPARRGRGGNDAGIQTPMLALHWPHMLALASHTLVAIIGTYKCLLDR